MPLCMVNVSVLCLPTSIVQPGKGELAIAAFACNRMLANFNLDTNGKSCVSFPGQGHQDIVQKRIMAWMCLTKVSKTCIVH